MEAVLRGSGSPSFCTHKTEMVLSGAHRETATAVEALGCQAQSMEAEGCPRRL